MVYKGKCLLSLKINLKVDSLSTASISPKSQLIPLITQTFPTFTLFQHDWGVAPPYTPPWVTPLDVAIVLVRRNVIKPQVVFGHSKNLHNIEK